MCGQDRKVWDGIHLTSWSPGWWCDAADWKTQMNPHPHSQSFSPLLSNTLPADENFRHTGGENESCLVVCFLISHMSQQTVDPHRQKHTDAHGHIQFPFPIPLTSATLMFSSFCKQAFPLSHTFTLMPVKYPFSSCHALTIPFNPCDHVFLLLNKNEGRLWWESEWW
jgi:hypothetical protein